MTAQFDFTCRGVAAAAKLHAAGVRCLRYPDAGIPPGACATCPVPMPGRNAFCSVWRKAEALDMTKGGAA